MPEKRRYTLAEGFRDSLGLIGHGLTTAATIIIAWKDQPVIAGLVFIVGSIATRGITKETQARLLELTVQRLKALDTKGDMEEKDD